MILDIFYKVQYLILKVKNFNTIFTLKKNKKTSNN